MTQTNFLGRSRREERKARLRSDPAPQVLVVGGGINGASVFRELALQGVRVVLVERGDFCSGASSAPSRMIHGGLRYLENGEFSLVKESLSERNRLLVNAPHYVSPLATTVPIFEYFTGVGAALARFLGLSRKASGRGALVIKLGLTLYDIFSGRSAPMPSHRFAGGRETRRRWPHFAPGVKCSATYYDARISYPERLCLELIQDSMSANHDALAFNYLGVDSLREGQVVLRDTLTSEITTISPSYVVNAAGAWIDLVNDRILGKTPEARLIGGTKGSHLIVRNARLLRELGDNMVYYENQDGRVCILFAHFGNVLIGSTDIRIENPDDARCQADEEAYILESVRTVFPDIRVTPEQVLYTYSGVRPLPYSESGVTGSISRDHSLHHHPPVSGRPFPVLSLVGGKWTTFRAFGEQAANQVLGELSLKRTIDTRDLAIGGGHDFPRTPDARREWIRGVAEDTGLSADRIEQLLDRYGGAARDIAKFMASEADEPLTSLPDYSRGEILYIARHEDVETPEDIVVRRTAMAISGRVNVDVIEEISAILAADRKWPPARQAQAARDTIAVLTSKHGFVAERALRAAPEKKNRIA